ncbi:MAG: hypothetical protein KAJ54_01810 [Candidatus Aenigmarchaeota archaeon]|nr:hypothetical protein [Candidatus Aenigmarchaeota archaeon]
MFVTTVEFVVDIAKKELEDKLKAADNVDEFDIEDLDKNDRRKNILIRFNNPVDMKYLWSEIAETIKIKELDNEAIE